MKKYLVLLICFMFLLTGCFFDQQLGKINEIEKTMKEMIKENKPIDIGKLKITINSVTKKKTDCRGSFKESDGSCTFVQEPKGDMFLVFDVTIENNSNKDFKLTPTSVQLRAKDGEAGEINTNSSFIKSDLIKDVLSNEKLKGQVVFDVVESDQYSLFIEDFFNNFSAKAKIIVDKQDIVE